MNIDGAVRGVPGHSDCGRIFRNCKGFSKGYFSLYLSTKLTFEAEIIGFIIAVEIAKKLQWSPFWIEPNSAYVISISIFASRSRRLMFLGRSKEIGQKLSNDAKLLWVHVSYIYREGNCVADKLASLLTTLTQSFGSSHLWSSHLAFDYFLDGSTTVYRSRNF